MLWGDLVFSVLSRAPYRDSGKMSPWVQHLVPLGSSVKESAHLYKLCKNLTAVQLRALLQPAVHLEATAEDVAEQTGLSARAGQGWSVATDQPFSQASLMLSPGGGCVLVKTLNPVILAEELARIALSTVSTAACFECSAAE